MAIKTSIIGNLKNIMSKWFYTEDEVNTLLNGKSDSNHNHDSRYYLKTEVDAIEDTLRLAIESLVGFTASIVESLPQTGSSGVMYLVPNDGGVEQDYYTEYIWTDEEKFEKIGNTAVEVDLSGYATVSFVNSALADYVTSDELEGLLAGKADVVHSHSISDVSGLQSSLDGKSDAVHTHDDRYYTETEIDSQLSNKASTDVATTSANGLMSSTDKVKLDGVATGANKTIVDSAMSSTSTNPVQNKVVKAELDSLNNAKANKEHDHTKLTKTGYLSSGADLNDYTTVGYWTADISTTASLLNKPTNPPIDNNSGIRLEVLENSNGVVQIITTYSRNAENVNIYFRHCIISSGEDIWSAWNIILTNHNQSLITP